MPSGPSTDQRHSERGWGRSRRARVPWRSALLRQGQIGPSATARSILPEAPRACWVQTSAGPVFGP